MNKRIIMMMMVLAAAAVSLFAHTNDLHGRDIVDQGKLESVSGTLSLDDGEWILTAGKDVYNVHLGNTDVIFPDGVPFKEGDKAEVRGFLLKKDIAAVDVTVGGKKSSFRDESGRPLWAGRGNRENENIAENGRSGSYRRAVPYERGGAMGMGGRQPAPNGRNDPYGRNDGYGRNVPNGQSAPNARGGRAMNPRR